MGFDRKTCPWYEFEEFPPAAFGRRMKRTNKFLLSFSNQRLTAFNYSEVTKSHPKGDDDITFSID